MAGLILAAGWFSWLRPTTLGGEVSYVVVDGTSMEPTYDDGDLVLIRQQNEYSIGDVIAFRAGGTFDDPTRIIHRIVGEADDDHFVTQGDNRDEIDPWQPGRDDIIGSSVLHIPWAGSLAGLLTRPTTFAALGAAAVVAGGEAQRRRRRRRDRAHNPEVEPIMNDLPTPEDSDTVPVPRGAQPAPRWSRHTHPRWALTGLGISVALAVPVLALTWSALRAPDSTERVEVVGQLDQAIDVDYRLTGEPSLVYPTGEVVGVASPTGAVVTTEPLYTRLLEQIEVDLRFRADAPGADRLATSYAVDVVAETPDGYRLALPSIELTDFDGEASENVTIDLTDVSFGIASVGDLTGVGGDTYTVTISPRLYGSAGTGDVSVDRELDAPLSLVVDGDLMTVKAIEATGSEPLSTTSRERADYAIGPFDLSVPVARGVLGGLALVLVAGIAWFASVLFGGLGLGEPARIAARYRSQMVDVSTATAPPGPVVMVSGIEELARIAKVEQAVIIHEDLGDGAHRYRVFLGSVTYEYETAPEHGAAAQAADDHTTSHADGSGSR